MSSPPNEPYFEGLIFNVTFFTAGEEFVTLDYVNSNFLRATGYAYSRAIATTFNGVIFALGGIVGDGSGLSALNASNISTGTLSVSRGGTGLSTIPLGSLLIGNNANTFLQTTNLSWDNANSILNATNFSGSHSGSGAGLINLNVSNASAGTLSTGRGGTGATTFISGRLLYGDGVNPLAQSANLTWDNTNNILTSTKISTTELKINNTVINPIGIATTAALGTVQIGSGLSITGAGLLSANAQTPYTLPIATNANLGGVKSGNDISVNPTTGIMSLSGNDIYLNGTTNKEYSWVGSNSSLGRAATAAAYSSSSIINDVVLRSANNLILQSGVGASALIINTSNQAFFRNSVCIAGTAITTGSVLDITGNSIMRNALVVGGTTITSGYTLDVKGDVITSGNINLANTSRSLFWGGTNSNLGRAGVGGEYSTSAAINDIVLRSGNKLILQSGVGAAGIVIDTANNVGIGIAAPTAVLDIVKTHNAATTLDLLNMRFDANWGLKLQQSYTGAGNIQYNFIHRYNAVDYNSLTFKAGNIGINNTNPTNKLHLLNSSTSANADVGNISLYVYNPTNAANNKSIICNRIAGTASDKVIYSMDVANSHGWSIYTSGNNTALRINSGWDTGGADRITIAYNGAVGIQNSGFAIPNNYMAAGSLSIGNIGQNYGGGSNWNASTAGLMLECADVTEIAVHDSGNAVHSLIHYSTNGNITIGRNMVWGTANVNIAGNLSVGGTNINSIIDQRIKNQHLFSIYRVSITYYNFNLIAYWEGVWDIGTNLVFNEYNRPQLNVRWNISASINNGNGNDSNKYFFMNYFYNQLGNNIAFNTTHSYGTWSFQNYWNGSGNNFLRIICRLDSPADYLNVNIS